MRNAGTSSRLIHGAARRNWLSGPPHSEARTELVDASVRGHSCPASYPSSTRDVTETVAGCLPSVDRRPHQSCRSHRRGTSRAHLHTPSSSRRASAGLVRRGDPMRPQRLALHAPPCSASTTGVRAVASRLLAYLEDVREWRRFVVSCESAVRRRGPDGRGVSGAVRAGVPPSVRRCWPVARRRSDSRRLARLAGAGLGRMAEHLEGVRP